MVAIAVRRGGAESLTPSLAAWAKRLAICCDEPNLSREAIAAALEGAVAMHARVGRPELLWSGPSVQGSTLRRHDEALVDLVTAARERVLLVSFAAYRLEALSDALAAALARGVQLSLVLEHSEESEGRLSVDARLGFAPEILRSARCYCWPADARERDERQRAGLLHAKCAAADGREALITSANLTGFAMNLNIELGVRLFEPDLAARIERQFDALIHAGYLVRTDPML
ncbi:MAG: phospholipase [Deltaproteobacteria bacterium]|nr:phospholipase [Deltaproteobacteria bacterium]